MRLPEQLVGLGLADHQTGLAMDDAWGEWAEDPDAFTGAVSLSDYNTCDGFR